MRTLATNSAASLAEQTVWKELRMGHHNQVPLRMTQAQLETWVQTEAVRAVEYSVRHGDIGFANRLLVNFPANARKRSAVIGFCEKWGQLVYLKEEGAFAHRKRDPKLEWTDAYRDKVKSSDWKDFMPPAQSTEKSWLDLDEELQALLSRARKFAADPGNKVVFHQGLLKRLDNLSAEYRIKEGLEYENEAKRRTLFDQSVKNQTMRASPYAK